jgi:hypothetical protein
MNNEFRSAAQKKEAGGQNLQKLIQVKRSYELSAHHQNGLLDSINTDIILLHFSGMCILFFGKLFANLKLVVAIKMWLFS